MAPLGRYDGMLFVLDDKCWFTFSSLQDLPEGHCIFIRGIRVARRFMILRRKLKAAARPNPDPNDSDSEMDVELVPIQTVPEVKCPFGVFYSLY